ncbi:MAG TPA: nucleotide sugar dehydrogenase [Conexibacter sp.]|nr:nucleotide sugar dehydrogenase [Conexibacter sp.]
MRVVVVALGKIGLPLAAFVARAGHAVVGCDVSADVCERVNAARAPFPGEAGLEEALAEVVGDGRLRAQTDTAEAIAEGVDLVIVVPPLIVDADAQPDWRILDSVLSDVGRGLRAAAGTGHRGTVVCVETTLPVGTTRKRVAPALAAGSGLAAERDFFAAFSPERVFSGRIFADLRNYPKLVGGCSETGEERTVALYRQFIEPDAEVWPMGSSEAAELAKLAETTYRDLNIAYANELARHADRVGVDVDRVIDAANSQPFSHIHRPGVAVGGHCIPVYPHFFLRGAPEARLPAVAREVNNAMPAYAVELLAEALGRLGGARVLILGVAYRGGVKETAFSGAFALREALAARGAAVVAADPLYDDAELAALGFDAWADGPVDGAIVQTDHAEYRTLAPAQLPGARAVVDGRGVLAPAPFAAAGVTLRRIGRP